MPGSYTHRGGESLAAALSARLIEVDLANPADWRAEKKSPLQFLERTLERWIEEADADDSDNELDLWAGIIDRGRLCDEPAALERMLIVVEAGSYNIVEMKHVAAFLEGVHPRLPATWYKLFCGTVSLILGTWDVWDADEHVEMWEDYYDETEAQWGENGPGRPNPRAEFLPALREKPLARRTVRRLMQGLDTRRRTILDLTLQLAEAVEGAPEARLPDNFWDDLDHHEPACPAVVVMMERGDSIERTWDEVNDLRAQSGYSTAPAVAIEFNGTDDDSIKRAHSQFMAVARVVGLTARILELLPTRDPRTLVEVLKGEEAAV